MARFLRNNLANLLVITVIAVLVCAGAFYFISKRSTEASLQRVKIIPTGYTIYFEDWSIDKPGWQNPEAALVQDLGPTANFKEFNEENSAYPVRVGNPKSEILNPKQIQNPNPEGSRPGGTYGAGDQIPETIEPDETIVSESESFEQAPQPSDEGEGQVSSPSEPFTPAPPSEDILLNLIATESEEDIFEEIATESPSFAPDGATEGEEEVSEVQPPIIQTTPNLIEKTLEFFDFSVPEEFTSEDGEKEISNVQPRLSMAFEGGSNQDVLDIEYKYSPNSEDSNEGGWHLLAEYFLSDPNSNATNNGYWLYAFPIFKNWKDLENLRIRFTYRGTQGQIYLDAVWLEVEYEFVEAEETQIATQKDAEIEFISDKKDFKLDEEPEFEFRYQRKVGLLKKIANLFKDEYKDINIKATVLGLDVSPNIRYQKNGEFFVELPKPPRQFRPGRYKLKIEIEDNGGVFIQEQDFTWGVLAINASKSIYLPGEEAYLQMAVLRDDGHTICNANLKLEIISPSGGSTSANVEKSGECGPNNVTDVPDYFAYYQVGSAGTYEMKLTNLDNGYEITDSFEVKKEVPFEVERTGPTRIYPPAIYQMTLRIKANQDFVGEVIEYVPASFEILNANPYTLNPGQITWQVDWKAGETYELEYQFDALDISPYLYLLGPLEFYE